MKLRTLLAAAAIALAVPANAQDLSNGWATWTTPQTTDQTLSPLSIDKYGNLRVTLDRSFTQGYAQYLTPLGTKFVAASVPGTIFAITVTYTGGASANDIYIYDAATAAAAPACGAAPFIQSLFVSPTTTAGYLQSYSFDTGALGIHVNNGVVMCSLTGPTVGAIVFKAD